VLLEQQQAQLQERHQELGQRQVPEQEPRWRHRNLEQRWLASSWHCASSIRWCRSSKPVGQKRLSSCQQFVRQRRLQALQRQTTSPLCSVSSWFSSWGKSRSRAANQDA